MLKEFWEQKKHIIQLVGILVAIGALFLSITPPQNDSAKEALSNIQLIWLVVITIGTLTVAIHFLILSVSFETHLQKKYSQNFESTLSAVVVIATLIFLFNIWKYTMALYKTSLIEFYRLSFGAIGSLTVPLTLIFVPRILKSLKKDISPKIITFTTLFIISLFGSILLVTAIDIRQTGWLLPLLFVGVFIGAVVVDYLFTLYRKSKAKQII